MFWSHTTNPSSLAEAGVAAMASDKPAERIDSREYIALPHPIPKAPRIIIKLDIVRNHINYS
jgi:hypothetical protein